MSVSYIPDPVKYMLWAKAAGRCQYDGCSKVLYLDDFTKAEFNNAYIAHIVADKPDGPRGDAILSPKLKADISNLMLLCDSHHRLIDKVDEAGHPVDRLTEMKKKHEEWIEQLTSISEERKSHILIYGANIGKHESPLTYDAARRAMVPDRYPAGSHPFELGMKSSAATDSSNSFWETEEAQLVSRFNVRVAPIKGNDPVQHFSVFALAPQPLLIRLGTLLSDIYPADVYQRHREPATWQWQSTASVSEFEIVPPVDQTGTPALVFSLSGTVTDERITSVLGPNTSIWKITIANPNNDFLKTKALLQQFRATCRTALNSIKAAHGENSLLNVFPAMPVSAAVEFGRVWMPKADLPMQIYDQNTAAGGFIKAIEIKNN